MTAQPVIRELAELDDVRVATPAQGDTLQYDSTSGKFQNGPVAPGASNAGDTNVASGNAGGAGDIIFAQQQAEAGRFHLGSLTLQKPTYWSVQGGGQSALAAQNSGGATAMGVLVFYGTGGTVNGLGPQGQSFGIGVDATDRSSLFIGRVNADNSTTDFVFVKWNNGNGAPFMGVGVTQGFPTTAALSVSGSDGDRTQGAIAIRKNVSYITDGDGLPLRVFSSSDGTIRQAFNVHGGLWLGGNPDGLGYTTAQGVQFIASGGGAGGANPPTIDSSLYLSGAGVITTDALLQTLHSETAHRGFQVGIPANFPLNIQQDFAANNKSAQIGHNVYNIGTTTYWSATNASFGSRVIYFDGGSGASGGIVFSADSAATTAGQAATTTERLRIRNDGSITVNGGAVAGGVGVIGIHNSTTAPPNTPANGGVLYVTNGALFWKGSGGTVTQLAGA